MTKEFFRVVVFLKDNDANVDADISLVAKFSDGKEMVFLLAPESEKTDVVYIEHSSKFLHRLERGIYLAQSRNKRLFSAKEIVARAHLNGERVEKRVRL